MFVDKQALINNGFPNYIVDEQIKCIIKNVNQQNKQYTTPSSQHFTTITFYLRIMKNSINFQQVFDTCQFCLMVK